MKRHEIDIRIDPKGSVTGTVVGIKGKSCRAITELLSEIGRSVSIVPTPEYFEKGNIKQTVAYKLTNNRSENAD
jgi:hypothetical protein